MVWRALARKFEPDQPGSALARLQKLMAWTFSEAKLETDLSEFELAVQHHERDGGDDCG